MNNIMIESALALVRQQAREKGAIKLGQLIQGLEAISDKTKSVQFDFGGFVPDSIMSYRGYYDHLSFDWVERGNDHSVARILVEAKSAMGKVFTGYKGGEFLMDASTPVWAAQYGDCTSTAIIGVTEYSWVVVLDTAFID
jgi:hypothetical protein